MPAKKRENRDENWLKKFKEGELDDLFEEDEGDEEEEEEARYADVDEGEDEEQP